MNYYRKNSEVLLKKAYDKYQYAKLIIFQLKLLTYLILVILSKL